MPLEKADERLDRGTGRALVLVDIGDLDVAAGLAVVRREARAR
jgi:hypothetical protein